GAAGTGARAVGGRRRARGPVRVPLRPDPLDQGHRRQGQARGGGPHARAVGEGEIRELLLRQPATDLRARADIDGRRALQTELEQPAAGSVMKIEDRDLDVESHKDLKPRLRHVLGKEGKPAVLMLHGGNTSTETFLQPNGGVARYLHERDLDVWLLDWRS